MPARSRTAISVASPRITTGPNSSSSRANRSGRCSIIVTSCPSSTSERVTFDRPSPLRRRGRTSGRRLASESPHAPFPAAPRSRSGSERRCSSHDPRRASPAPGRARERRPCPTSYRCCSDLADHEVRVVAVVATTTASAVFHACALEHRYVHPMPDDEPAAPVRAEPPERILALVDPPSLPSRPRRDPSRPRIPPGRTRSRRAFTALRGVLLEDSVGEGDDEDLARRVSEYEVDGRREEPRLPPPPRRRSEDDEVQPGAARPPRRLRDRSSAHGRRPRAPPLRDRRRARAPPRATHPLGPRPRGKPPSSANFRGTRTTVIASIAEPRSFASAIAVATISSPMSPSFIGTRMRSNSVLGRPLCDRRDLLEQSPTPPPAHRDEDGESREQPDGPGVAGARVRDHREHEDRGGERSADERCHRELGPSDRDVRPRAERAHERRARASGAARPRAGPR